MQKKRVFRQDFVSLTKEYNFKRGEIATIVQENIPDVTFKINNNISGGAVKSKFYGIFQHRLKD